MDSVGDDCVEELFSSVASKIGTSTAKGICCVVLPLGNDIASNEFNVVSVVWTWVSFDVSNKSCGLSRFEFQMIENLKYGSSCKILKSSSKVYILCGLMRLVVHVRYRRMKLKP